MKARSRRCQVGSALAVVIFAGCSSRSPLFDSNRGAALSDGAVAAPTWTVDPVSMQRTPESLPVLDETATLDTYVRYAALTNPGLEAKFHEWKAAVERLPQVAALPDPRFTYGYYLGEVETRVGPMQHSLSVSQTFPWFGKLQDREDAAARQANAGYRRFESARLELSLRVERAYNELFFLKQSIDATSDNIELLQQIERVARTRYRVAAAQHPDIIKVQLELGTLEDRLRQLRDLRTPHTARLNAILDRPADSAIPWPPGVSERVTSDGHAALFATLQTHNPELLALQEEIERERIGWALARKDGQPDLTVGLAYTVIGERGDVTIAENGDDAVLGTLSINLPIWREKYDAAVREAVARRLAAASRRGAAVNQLSSDLQEALFEHEDARRRVSLYQDTLLPKAEESLQATLGGFEQSTSDFFDLIDTQRTLLEFQLGLARALVDRATSYARLERLVGVTEFEMDSPKDRTP